MKWLALIALIFFLIVLSLTNFGYLSVSDQDVKDYGNKLQIATDNFLQNGVLTVDDASGLSYRDSNGVWVTGALTNSEIPFVYVIFPLTMVIFSVVTIYLFFKTFRRGKKK